MRRRMTDALCRCGHPFVSHEHLRRGTECVWCSPGTCEQFRPPTFLDRWRRRRGDDERTSSWSPTLVLVR